MTMSKKVPPFFRGVIHHYDGEQQNQTAEINGNGMISLSDLWFSYDGSEQATLQGLSLEIPSGAITAILGPNGSGKTTLLRLILGTLSPKQGTILLAEQPQRSYTRREMSQLIGLVPQQEHVPFDFSVLEYVLLGRAPYLRPLEMPGEVDHQVALEALQVTGLTQLRHRLIPNLSVGERQLAVMARALAQKPRILLLDEPTSHLDLSNKGRILQILRTCIGEGRTLILTTHDPDLAAAARFVVLLRRGQILDAGPAELVLTSRKLSATYGVPVQVLQIGQRRVVLSS